MDMDSRDSNSKRALEAKEGVVEGESKEKRPRIVSDISVISEPDENVVVEEPAENSPTEVIYELSSDNDESLLNASEKRSSNEISPVRSEKNVEAEADEEKDEENDVKMKSESEEEESEGEDSEESSESEDSGENEDDDEGTNVDNEEHRKVEEKATDKNKRSEDKKTAARVEDLSSEEESEDDGEAADRKQNIVIDISSDAMHDSDAEKRQDSSVGTRRKESTEAKEKKALYSSVDGAPNSSKEMGQEKRKRLESSDYNTKTMEDLEDLQEDLHKELAEITGKTLQKRKSKKASSSGHRDKRHKEKTTSRHKEKERQREKEGGDDRPKEREKEKPKDRERGKDKQRSTESRGDFRREVTVGTRKEHDKERKYHEVDDKPWLYESRRARPQKDEAKDRGGETRHWMETRLERPSSRTEMKSVVERKVRKDPKASKEGESRAKEAKPTDTAKETEKEPVKKGIMSDSMRELVRQSIKENKGLAQEVVEEESDESPEHFFKVQTSDVSSASESEEEPAERESSPEVLNLPPYLPAIQGCRSVEEFQWLNRIEEGTYGVVYRAKDKRTGEVVALKKLKMEKEKEGFPITSLREINTLLKAQHPNIVTVQEIVVGSNMDKIYIVMDFVEHDLKALMETMTQSFLAGEIKTIMIQLLRAVNHLHDNWILHRDIKTSNLLLSNKGILKVGDFGLAREYGSPLKAYTPIVVTLWYRAPELLLGAKEYSTPIDVWSVGCVFAELLTMKPLFNGQSEISQINKIFKELGTPSDKIWPGPPAYSELPATKKMTFAEYPYNNLRNKFGATLTDNGFDLLNSFLTYDPNRRITAEDALKHEYFKESPSPVDPSLFPSWPARSEGAKRAKKASPKAPEGGNFYKSLSGDGDGAFHIPVGKSQGKTTVPGFTLKF